MPDFHGNPPAERVQAYLDQLPEGFNELAVLHDGPEADTLTVSDLRDVLTQLDEALDFIGQVDAVLDLQATHHNEDADTLYDIRTLFGNHSDRKGLTND